MKLNTGKFKVNKNVFIPTGTSQLLIDSASKIISSKKKF